MPAQVQGDCPVTVVREEIEEMVIPAPCGETTTVNKKQWNRMRVGGRPFVDHFEHLSHHQAALLRALVLARRAYGRQARGCTCENMISQEYCGHRYLRDEPTPWETNSH